MAMDSFISALNYVLAITYVIGIVAYGAVFFADEKNRIQKFCRYSKATLRLIIFLHLLYFVLRIIDYSHSTVTSIFELLTLLAFSLTITYMYIEFRTGVFQTGFFILLIAGIFQVISTIFIKELKEINPVLKSWLLGAHVSGALIGYSAILFQAYTVSFI
jgi:ABC-type transport system involved in cytochrome c biogenesis permease subunit